MKKLYELIEGKIGMDKVAHFFGVALVAAIVSLLFYKVDAGDSSWVYAFEGLFAGAVVALGKEVFDFLNGREFSTKDILAGLIGAVVVFLLIGITL